MSWQPLVTKREPVLAAIAQLAGSVEGATVDHALMRYYLALDDALPDPDDRGSEALAGALEALTTSVPFAALHGGLAGVGWVVAHVADAEEVCASIDARLLADLDRVEHFDVIGGFAGIGIYALERGGDLAARVLAALESRATRTEHGITWVTPARPERDTHVDAGVAHGTPGVIAVLARYAVEGHERARSMLDAAVPELLALAPPRAGGRYAAWYLGGRGEGDRARLAWCYGDLGVSLALLSAAIARGRDDWRREAIALAHACAARDEELGEPGICHGVFGVAHLFARLHHATGDARFAEAARRGLERGLARLAPSVDLTLLTGAAGIVLVLHAAISDVEPSWDRLLVVDV